MDDDPDLTKARIGKTLKGRYTLDALIGIGGMASVYRGRHRNGNKVAVKVLHPDLAVLEDIRKRFLREGYVANKVDHRGAVTVLDDDVDEEDGSVFLVMELLEGQTLEELIVRRGGKLAPEEILPCVKQLLEVLGAAHDKGIVHRDLKPENVFLEREGGGIKVLDFGIARLADGTGMTTHTGQVIGTPAYMAPEQARGETTRVGPATDLWAVGAILFRALTGRVVYDAKAPAMSVVLAGTRPPPKIAEVMPTLDAELAAVIDRTLDPVIEERWSSAAAMLAALEKLDVASGAPTMSKTEVAMESPFADGGALAPTAQRTLVVEGRPTSNAPPSPSAPTPAPAPGASAPPPAVAPTPPPAAPVPAARGGAGLRVAIVAIAATLAGGIAFGAYALARANRAATVPPTASVSATTSASAEPLPSSSSSDAPPEPPAAASASAAASTTMPPASASAAAVPSATAKEAHDETTPSRTRPMGFVTVAASPPGTKVMTNGVVLCERMPCIKKAMLPGEHTLRLQAPDGTTKTVQVLVRAGETTTKTIHMK